MPTRNEILIGHAPVDSGSIVVGDPCYLAADGASDVPTWTEIVDQLFDSKGQPAPGEKNTTAIKVNDTFITSTPHGDGQYPVYAEVDERGQVTSLRIDLDPEPVHYDDDEYDEGYDD